MKAILVHVETGEKAAIAAAAEKLGVTQKAFCRRAAVDLARRLSAHPPADLLSMMQEIWAAVCDDGDNGGLAGEAGDAVAALVGLGITKKRAKSQVTAVLTLDPDLEAAEIIRQACTKEN